MSSADNKDQDNKDIFEIFMKANYNNVASRKAQGEKKCLPKTPPPPLIGNLRDKTSYSSSTERNRNQNPERVMRWRPLQHNTTTSKFVSGQSENSSPPSEDCNVAPLNDSQEEQFKSNWRDSHPTIKDKLTFIFESSVGKGKKDVVCIVGSSKERIYAHSFILWLHSSYFDNILNPDRMQSRMKEITLKNITPNIFGIVLCYMYKEELPSMDISPETIGEIYKVAILFEMNQLAAKCIEILKKRINLENAVKCLQMGREFAEPELKKLPLEFILSNGDKILSSSDFLSLSLIEVCDIIQSDDLIVESELAVFNAVVEWAKKRCYLQEKEITPEIIRAEMGIALYKIRVPLMSSDMFNVHVLPSRILPPMFGIDLCRHFMPPYIPLGADFPFSSTPRRSPDSSSLIENLPLILQVQQTPSQEPPPFALQDIIKFLESTNSPIEKVKTLNIPSVKTLKDEKLEQAYDQKSFARRKRADDWSAGSDDDSNSGYNIRPCKRKRLSGYRIESIVKKEVPSPINNQNRQNNNTSNFPLSGKYKLTIDDDDDDSVIFIPSEDKKHIPMMIDLHSSNEELTDIDDSPSPPTSSKTTKKTPRMDSENESDNWNTMTIDWESSIKNIKDESETEEGQIKDELTSEKALVVLVDKTKVKNELRHKYEKKKPTSISPTLKFNQFEDSDGDDFYLHPSLVGGGLKNPTKSFVPIKISIDSNVSDDSLSSPALKVFKESEQNEPKDKSSRVGVENGNLTLPIWPVTTPSSPMEITTFINQIKWFPKLDCLTNLEAHLLVSDTSTFPSIKVEFPNLKNFILNLQIEPSSTSRILSNRSKAKRFKDTVRTLFGSDGGLQKLVFIKNKNSIKMSTHQNALSNFDKIWNYEIKVCISLNGVKIFESNSDQLNKKRSIICAFIPYKTSTYSNYSSIFKGYDGPNAPNNLTFAGSDCDIRSFHYMASPSLENLTILKIYCCFGIQKFLRNCVNLKELRLDGRKQEITSGTLSSTLRIPRDHHPASTQFKICLDEDLHMFRSSCKLEHLVLSDLKIGVKFNSNVRQQCMVTSPIFYFCNFEPPIFQNFERLFPNLKSYHAKKYHAFVKRLLNMNHIETIVLWGDILPSSNDLNVRDIREESLIGSERMRMEEHRETLEQQQLPGTFYRNMDQGTLKFMMNKVLTDQMQLHKRTPISKAFILNRVPLGKPLTQQKMLGISSDILRKWNVTEYSNSSSSTAGALALLKFAFTDFNYSSVMDFEHFLVLFKKYY